MRAVIFMFFLGSDFVETLKDFFFASSTMGEETQNIKTMKISVIQDPKKIRKGPAMALRIPFRGHGGGRGVKDIVKRAIKNDLG